MQPFNSASAASFSRSRISEAIVEVGLTAAAAAFTAAIWLSVGGWAVTPGRVVETTQAARPAAVQHVTLPTVYIVGRRETLEGTPATTTAQNTAANPVTLHQ